MTPTLNDNISPKGLYSVLQTARLLGVAKQTIYNWLNANDVFRSHEVKASRCGHRNKTRILGSAIRRVWNESI